VLVAHPKYAVQVPHVFPSIEISYQFVVGVFINVYPADEPVFFP